MLWRRELVEKNVEAGLPVEKVHTIRPKADLHTSPTVQDCPRESGCGRPGHVGRFPDVVQVLAVLDVYQQRAQVRDRGQAT
jgi:hypothetical protein